MHRHATRLRAVPVSVIVIGLLAACAPAPAERSQGEPAEATAQGSEPAAVLSREMERVDAALEEVDSVFQPLPLLRPAQEEALRAYPNARQLARARELGIDRGLPGPRLSEHERAGHLVRLSDSEYWVVADLDHSQPLAVPGVRDLLNEIGERFHARLAEVGAPPFRFEISSVLRTAADQEALRAVNPNAALSESTHEYGTSVDLLYSAFAAPAQLIVRPDVAEAPWVEPVLERYARVAAERVAARRALELKALLGEVLLELQREGRVMVTFERLQPVFHMTLASRP